MTRRTVSVCYKVLVILTLSIGILLNIMKTTSIQAMLSYYTMQSNIISLAGFYCFLYLEIKQEEKTDMYYLIKGAIVIAIFITAVVYGSALAPTAFVMDTVQKSFAKKRIASLFVHLFSPTLVISDYFFFDKKGKFKSYYPFFWLIIPLNYVCYVYMYHSLGGKFFGVGGSKHFAYFFLDYEKIGYLGVAKWILLMSTAIVFVSYLLVFIDSMLGKNQNRSR